MNVFLFILIVEAILGLFGLWSLYHEHYGLLVLALVVMIFLLVEVTGSFYDNAEITEEVEQYEIVDYGLSTTSSRTVTAVYTVSYKDGDRVRTYKTNLVFATQGNTRVSVCILKWGFLKSKEKILLISEAELERE